VVPKDDSTLDQFSRRIRSELHFVRDVPLLFTSALTRQRVRRILDLALEVKDKRVQRIATGSLNNVIQSALQRHQPMSHSGKMLKLRYVTQVKADPPTFVFFVNDPELVHFSYRRFLENQLRENFGFAGTALRLIFRSSREAPEVDPAGTRSGISRPRVVAAGPRKPVTGGGMTRRRGPQQGGSGSSGRKSSGRPSPKK
jgi:GTP-binding protein